MSDAHTLSFVKQLGGKMNTLVHYERILSTQVPQSAHAEILTVPRF